MSEADTLRKMLNAEQLPPPTWQLNWQGKPMEQAGPQPAKVTMYKGPDGKLYDEESARAAGAFGNASPQMFKGPDGKMYTREQAEAMGAFRTDTEAASPGKRILQDLASYGTGAAHGAIALGNLPIDLAGLAGKQLFPDQPRSGTKAMMDLADKYLYQPQNREERLVSALGSAVLPAAVGGGGNVVQALNLAGGPLGQALAESNTFDNPELGRFVGNVAPGMIGPAVGAPIGIAGSFLHYADLPKWLHWVVDLGGHMMNAGKKMAGATPSIVEGALQHPGWEPQLAEAMAKYAPNFSPPALGDVGKQISNLAMKLLTQGGLSPEMQYQANQTNMPLPPATVGY